MTSAAPSEQAPVASPPAEPSEPLTPYQQARALIPDAAPTDDVAEGAEAKPAPAEGESKEGEAKADSAEGEKKELGPKEKAFAALKRKQEKIAREKAELERTKSEMRAQFDAEMARIRHESERLGHLSDIDRLAKEDPKAAADKLGLDFTKLSQAYLNADTLEAKLEAQQRAQEQMAKRLEAYEREKQEAQARAQAESHRAQAEKAFVGVIRGAEESFPELSIYDDQELVQLGNEAADKLTARMGRVPRYEEIAQALEDHFAERQKRREAKRHGQSPNPSAERDTAPSTSANREAPRAHSRTLTNRVASESSGRERPLSEQERFAVARKLLE